MPAARMRAASASMPRSELRQATGVQNSASTRASAAIPTEASEARNCERLDRRGSRQILAVRITDATAPIAISTVSALTIARKTVLSNSGPPGSNRLRHMNAANAANAINRLSGGAPDSAADATSRKNAVAVTRR